MQQKMKLLYVRESSRKSKKKTDEAEWFKLVCAARHGSLKALLELVRQNRNIIEESATRSVLIHALGASKSKHTAIREFLDYVLEGNIISEKKDFAPLLRQRLRLVLGEELQKSAMGKLYRLSGLMSEREKREMIDLQRNDLDACHSKSDLLRKRLSLIAENWR